MEHYNYSLGELVYMTNRLARGSPDSAFTEKSGPGMVVGVVARRHIPEESDEVRGGPDHELKENTVLLSFSFP